MVHIAFAFLLFTFTAYLATHADPEPLAAQVGKKKKKDKDKLPDPPPSGEQEEVSRVSFTYDPGSHTQPISALGFNKDGTKLITVGWDYTIQVWSTATGERLDILRLPGYGREKGYDTNRWSHAAVSPDGNFVALGGGPKLLWGEEHPRGEPTRMILVDMLNRKPMRVMIEAGVSADVTRLEFSPDSKQLAVGVGGRKPGIRILHNLEEGTRNTGKRGSFSGDIRTLSGTFARSPTDLAFSPDGDRLAVGEEGSRVTIWDANTRDNPAKPIGEFVSAGRTTALAWSPDGTQVARAIGSGAGGKDERGIEIRDVTGKLLKLWSFYDLEPGFSGQTNAFTLRYLAADRLYVSSHGDLGQGRAGFGPVAAILDPTTGKSVRLFSEVGIKMYRPDGAVSLNGQLGATTVRLGMETVIYRLADGKIVAKCGTQTPIPSVVGWSSDEKAPAFYWSETRIAGTLNTKVNQLEYGFDLTRLEPTADLKPDAIATFRLKHQDWTASYEPGGPGQFIDVVLKKGDVEQGTFQGGNSMTLIPNGDKLPMLAVGRHVLDMGSRAFLYEAQGKRITEWLPVCSQHRDMASSPDGRYVVTNTGTHRLSIYRTDGSMYPFLNLVRINGEWVLWTAEGYYAASPGGEKLIGWAESHGPNALATFHTADKFSKQFRRPDIIKLAIEKGSVAEALKELKTKPADIEQILPPTAELTLVKQAGSNVTVKAAASSGVKDKPVRSMQLLLDGRPLSEGRGVLTVEPGKPAEAEWQIIAPSGSHELRLMARSDDGPAISEPVVVIGPKSAGEQPTIHRLCIGINDYDDPGLRLTASTKDAADVFAAIEKYCVGSLNRYGAAAGQLIVDKAATRDAIKEALRVMRKSAKPGDLVVLYFAGHGVKQDYKDAAGKSVEEYYLLTREADTSKSLHEKSLSGQDLYTWLRDMECPVLFIMDACHSAKGLKAFRPATDDLTRGLTTDSAGVTVMAAAMAHEVAMASSDNGYFTAALIKALAAGDGVPFDPHERALYTHHIYSVVFSEVRHATHGKQNPFLNSPWTVPPLAVREIAKQP